MKTRIVLSSLALLILAVITFNYFSLDGIVGVLAPFGFPDDTTYSPDYTAHQFAAVRRGESEAYVLRQLGEPIERVFVYGDGHCQVVWITQGRVRSAYPSCAIRPGEGVDVVLRTLGTPKTVKWLYSTSRQGGSYRERVLVFENGTITEKRSSYYID